MRSDKRRPWQFKHVAAALLGLWLQQASADEGLRFPISGYAVTGADFLSAAEVDALLAPFTGPKGSFDQIQQAVETLEKHLLDRGHAAARVFLPQQEVDDGRIRLRVVVAVVGAVEIDGNRFHDSDNLRRALPALREGQSVDMLALGADLRVSNENPSKQTRLVFRQSSTDGQIDAVLRVTDEDPLRLALSLDNSGSDATGRFRMGLLLQHANLFNADHAVSAQIVTSPGHQRDVLIAGVGYRLPLYGVGDSMDFAYGYSNVDSGQVTTAGGNYAVSGSGQTASVRYNVYLPRVGAWDQKLILGADWRAYRSDVRPAGGGAGLVPDLTVHPLSVSYVSALRGEGINLSATVSYHRNVPGGSDGTTAAFNRPGGRAGASADYDLWRYSGSIGYTTAGDWQLRAAFSGQLTRHALIPGEQFGVGGSDSVRGMSERALANDFGHRGGLEVQTPDVASTLGFEQVRARLAGFVDAGWVRRNRPLPGEVIEQGVLSAGAGVRVLLGQNVSARLDLARVLDGDGVVRRGAHRLHGQMLWLF